MMFDSFEDYDVQQVRADTRKETEERTRKEVILEILEDYGEIPEYLSAFVISQTDIGKLKEWSRIARHVSSIEEFAGKVGYAGI